MNMMWDRHNCFKTLLNIKDMICSYEDTFLNSKKKYKTFIISLMTTILENPKLLDDFMTYGGQSKYFTNKMWVKPNGEVFVKNGDKT